MFWSQLLRLVTESATIESLRALTFFMSTETWPADTPKSAARRAMWATRALAISDLVGMQPLLTQVPPIWARSTSSVFLPAPARRAASGGPDWPPPITMASKELGMAWLLCWLPMVRGFHLSLIHISEPTRQAEISYAV